MEKKVFCPHCNQEALTYTVIREGGEEICCLYCGMLLERPPQKKDIEAQPVGSKLKTVLYTDDSLFMRELVTDIFSNKKEYIKDFITFDSGESLIYHFTKLLIEKKKTDLIILDIRMPHLTGIGAANAIRAIERAFNVSAIPFLYFSSKEADDELKKLIEHTAPAYYLNKGASTNIEELEKRLIKSVMAILKV